MFHDKKTNTVSGTWTYLHVGLGTSIVGVSSRKQINDALATATLDYPSLDGSEYLLRGLIVLALCVEVKVLFAA